MKKKILVVEDSPTQAQRAQLILRNQGYDVKWAPDGREALKAAADYRPDMVVTDLMMPNMNGYQMTSALKAAPATKDIPVLMLTTKNEVNDIIKGLAAGADNFITKPYESRFLLERIENIFTNCERRRNGGVREENELADFKNKIELTTNRQQILKLLLGAISVVIHCNVIGIFLLSERSDKHVLLTVSLQPLAGKSALDLQTKLLAAAGALVDEELRPGSLRVTKIVKDVELPPVKSVFNSFISVPLIYGGDVIGILTAANTEEQAFKADDVKFLFMFGSESAAALNQISR